MAERWLVIGHEATNTGAPRMLLEVLRGVQACRGADWSCEILLVRGGVLEPEFARLGLVQVLSHPWAEGTSLRAGIFRRFVDRPWIQRRRLARWREQHGRERFDLIYNNTATNGRVVSAVRDLGGTVLTHVHELAAALRQLVAPGDLAQTLANTDHFLAVSGAAVADLAELGVAADRITVAPNFLPALPPEPDAAARGALRRSLGLPVEASVITGCGPVHEIKGTDLFVELAAALATASPRKLLFNWIGDEPDARFARKIRRLARARGVDAIVRFRGPVRDAQSWFAASDVVTVTSRVESSSLVALEAASLGVPVVGFAGARGLAELLGGQEELLVREFDPAAMASVAAGLLDDPAKAGEQGRRLRAKAAARFLRETRLAAILEVTDRLRKTRGSRP